MGRDMKNPPIFLAFRSSSTFILSTICIAVFTDIFLYTVIVPVIPFALTNRAGVPPDDVQHWVSILLAVYGAALLAASPLCGFLADKTPNRRLSLLVGLLALAGATLLLCLGNSLALLILGRALQGISAAIVWTVGLALLADTVGHEMIGQAVGYVSISMSAAFLTGPLLGGVIYAKAGYYSVYFVAFGMIILDIALRILLIEKHVARQWAKDSNTALPPPPQAAAAAPPPQTQPTDPAPAPPSPTPQTPAPPSSSPPSPRPPKKPLPPLLTLLLSRRLHAALLATLFQSILFTSWDAVLPLYTAHLFSFTSLGAGLIFLPLIVPSFLAPLVGWWVDKRGPRVPATLGFAVAVPFLVLLRLVDHGGVGQVALLAGLLAGVGLAVGGAMVPLLAEITFVVGAKEASRPGQFAGGRGAYATAYGLFNTAFAGGMLIGPLWAGFVVNSAGWGTMCWSLAVLSVGGAVVSGLFVGGWIGRRGRGEKAKGQREGDVEMVGGAGGEGAGDGDARGRAGDGRDEGVGQEEQERPVAVEKDVVGKV